MQPPPPRVPEHFHHPGGDPVPVKRLLPTPCPAPWTSDLRHPRRRCDLRPVIPAARRRRAVCAAGTRADGSPAATKRMPALRTMLFLRLWSLPAPMQSPPSRRRTVLRMGKTLEARTRPGRRETQREGRGAGHPPGLAVGVGPEALKALPLTLKIPIPPWRPKAGRELGWGRVDHQVMAPACWSLPLGATWPGSTSAHAQALPGRGPRFRQPDGGETLSAPPGRPQQQARKHCQTARHSSRTPSP